MDPPSPLSLPLPLTLFFVGGFPRVTVNPRNIKRHGNITGGRYLKSRTFLEF